MPSADSRDYQVEAFEVVMESPQARVVELILASGEEVPWHYHNAVSDTFYCLEGTVLVELRGGADQHELSSGERLTVPHRTAHRVSAPAGRCRFLVIQGVGAYDFVPLGRRG